MERDWTEKKSCDHPGLDSNPKSYSMEVFGFLGKLVMFVASFCYLNMDVSLNCGTPKSSILIGISIINHPFWGTPIFGNTHILQFQDFSRILAQALPISRESFIWIILKTILCLVVDFQGLYNSCWGPGVNFEYTVET